MNALLIRFLASILLLVGSAHAQILSDLNIVRSGSGFTLRWHAAAGTTQLVWKQTLSDAVPWVPFTGSVPQDGGLWETPFALPVGRAFFTLRPPVAPVAPPNVRLVLVEGRFRLEWDSTSEAAGYRIYVGLGPNVGPGTNVGTLTLNLANSVEIDGLSAGQTYYLAIAATNVTGEGALSPALVGVFGPKGVLSGNAVQVFPLADGSQFEVAAEGAIISVYDPTNPVGPYLSATADATGYFRIPFLRTGTFPVSYSYRGQSGTLPPDVVIAEVGATLAPLVLPIAAPPPGSRLAGTLTLSNGDPARIDLDEFAVHARGQVVAVLANGGQMTVVPDATGAWGFTNLPNSYPITLTGTYRGLQTSTVIATPPAALTRIDLQFSQALPGVREITATQGGVTATTLLSDVAVSFSAAMRDGDAFPATPRWVAEFNGEKVVSTAVSPTFVFTQSPGPPGSGFGDPLDSGTVNVTFYPSDLTATVGATYSIPIVAAPAPPAPALGAAATAAAVAPAGPRYWSGTVTIWNPATPTLLLQEYFESGSYSTVTVSHSGTPSPMTVATGEPVLPGSPEGFFELPLNPEAVPPYLVRVEKFGHMRFLWPFEKRLPIEAQFSVVRANYQLVFPGTDGWIVSGGVNGGYLSMPLGTVVDANGVPFTEEINVQTVSFNTNQHYPWPPGAEVRGANLRNGIRPYTAFYFELTTQFGAPLRAKAGATLNFPAIAGVVSPTVSAYHQVEATGYFERWANATQEDPGQYIINLGTNGLFLIGTDLPLVEVAIEADKTINYPFTALIDRSIFPVTVQSFQRLDLGRLFAPRTLGVKVRVLDLRQAPGISYAAGTSPLGLSPMQKTVIVDKTDPLNVAAQPLPAVARKLVTVSLADTEPKLKTVRQPVSTLNSKDHFLTRPGVTTYGDALAYYQRIKAPTTLAKWRTLSDLPQRFGDALNLPEDQIQNYATAYYYNLGDLGFARAQTMRIKNNGDIAFLVTNYKNIDDALAGRSPGATVCMDYALRTDGGATTPKRYTRFYVYGSSGNLLQQADLDGSGFKGVPNLCINCHGGRPYDRTDPKASTDLGSRFLPFDLESYGFHPKFGRFQFIELAKMNAAVLGTAPTTATANLIHGWYGGSPLNNPNNFNSAYVPSLGTTPWSANPNLYNNVFKGSCRVCHNSRQGTSFQFESLGDFQKMYPLSAVGSTLQMPHTQRAWGILWGSRCAHILDPAHPDGPTILQNAAGKTFR